MAVKRSNPKAVRLPDADWQGLSDLAKREGIPRNRLIALAVRDLLAKAQAA
jgi:hypothetical protein